MSDVQDLLRKLFVKLEYLPPPRAETPVNCKAVKFKIPPQLTLDPAIDPHSLTLAVLGRVDTTRDRSIGIDLHRAIPFTTGAGGITLILQVTGYVQSVIEFTNTKNATIVEMHRVFVSMPIGYRMDGPRMALMAASRWPVKLVGYSGMIATAMLKMREVNEVVEAAAALTKGVCPADVMVLKSSLKAMETKLNQHLQREALTDTHGSFEARREQPTRGKTTVKVNEVAGARAFVPAARMG